MSTLNDEIVHNVLAELEGWQGDAHGIDRTLEITDAQHAELVERVKVVADAMGLRPELHRSDGHTAIRLRPATGDRVTPAEVTLAARIESAYRAIAGLPATGRATHPLPGAHRRRWRRS